MANSKNTNNSLSDLNNEGQQFNRALSGDELGNYTSNKPVTDDEKLKKEKVELINRHSSSQDEKEKADIENQISENQNQISNLGETGLDDEGLSDMTSLFDNNAIIDYGRYINSDGTVAKNWKHYNSEDSISFTNNSEITKKNEAVRYKEDNDSVDSDEGVSIPKLIEWSEKYPALQMKFQDFAYCKKLGYYPNNRLIILRRFKAGVPDNLFDYVNDSSKTEFNQPLSTMITWWKPDEEIGDMTFKFNENWTGYKMGLMDTFKAVASEVKGGAGSTSTKPGEGAGANDLVTSLLSESLLTSERFRKEDGVPYTRSSMGSPNLIHDAMVRQTGGDGLSSSVKFQLSFEYEMRDVNGIDPGIAMIDLISNCTRMGTSVGEFKYNIPAIKNSTSVKALINGDINKALEAFKTELKGFTADLKNGFNEIIDGVKNLTTNTSDTLGNLANNAIKYIISRYRERLKGALSVDTGLPSGIWHVTIGNPKAPIISCGDLVIDSSTLKLGNELGYNDFPNEFKVTYSLGTARPRGRDELNRIFNSGRGRVYVYPEAKYNPDYDLYTSDTPNSANDAKKNAINKK